jgi:hypothetical protein
LSDFETANKIMAKPRGASQNLAPLGFAGDSQAFAKL